MDPSRPKGAGMGMSNGREMSRAEKFEDEKRRIIESCFNKRDEDGSILETYITHIKITEYSSSPTTPPPPQARTPYTEKPRIIIIAVRKSGRVRMHKSKENPNGTFSIGKTWNLDELTAIESFTAPNTSPDFKLWAGDTGFIVTVGKPYYWQAQTDKEKKFFIASLIKIFGKYTRGKVPALSGFDEWEQEQVLGSAQRRQPPLQQFSPQPQSQQGTPQPPARSPYIPERVPAPSPGPPAERPAIPSQRAPDRSPYPADRSPFLGGRSPLSDQQRPPLPNNDSAATQSSLSAASSNYRPNGQDSYRPAPPRNQQQLTQDGASSPAGSFDSSRSANQAALRRLAGGNRSQDSVGASSLANKRDDGGSISTTRSREPQPPPQQQQPRPLNGGGGPYRGGSGFSDSKTTVASLEERPPERKRPPMDPARPQGYRDNDLVPAPLNSSGMRREREREPAVPPRSVARKPSVASRSDARSETVSVTGSLTGSLNDRDRSTPTLEQNRFEAVPPRSPGLNGSFTKPPELKPAEEPPAPLAAPPPVAPPSPGEPFPPPPEAPVETPISPDDEMRPGLGPMIRKKKSKGDIQGVLWKAANAAGAFRPRPGGAGDRLRQAQNKSNDGPDGITSVVPAPPRPMSVEKPSPAEQPAANEIPEVKVTAAQTSRPSSEAPAAAVAAEPKEAEKASEHDSKSKNAKEEERRSVLVGNDMRYMATLGLDPSILDNKSLEFTRWLDHFGWVPGEQIRARNYDDMKVDIERELNKAQAGGWLARFREEDERVEAIKKGIDLAIQECEELDNLLTLYSVELSTLSDDIAYIEAQGQGLQVQAANQKLLKKELESLLDTCAITQTDLEPLRSAPLESSSSLEEIETALVTLFKAMMKIDPSMGNPDARKSEDAGSDPSIGLNSNYGKMRMVQEKKEMYLSESASFMRRLVAFMAAQFDESYDQTKRAVDGPISKKIDPRNHDVGRDMLWKYSPLILYARDVDLENWNRIIQIYQDKSHPVYKAEFRDALDTWKRNTKATAGDDSDVLFTSQLEKQQEGGAQGVVSAARKLTVKRSQTLARTFRSGVGGGDSKTSLDKLGKTHSQPWEAFAGVMDELLPLVEMEQNFIVDFFHATTLEHADFPDSVAAARPRDRRGGDLRRHRLMEPDRELARRVTRAMEVIFTFLEQELQKFIDWVLSTNPLQGVGVLATLERKMADMSQSNQDFLNNVFQKLHGSLEARFHKFVDEQVRAIEETKVKIKKRKGVIPFIRVFPNFSAAVENMLADVDPALSVRRTVDREYDRILKSMFDSVKVIARDNPAVSAAAANSLADPEDKEALNFHILLIENMNYFLDEVTKTQQQHQMGGDPQSASVEVLEEWKEAAASELAEHMTLYLNAVMRRPLGRLLEHLENVEAQLASGKSPAAVAAQPSNTKATFNKVLGGYDAREVRKGLEALRKRVEKHFGDSGPGEDGSGPGYPGLPQQNQEHTQALVDRVLRECERFYGDVEMRISDITTNVYGGDVLFEWPRAEVKAGFAHLGR